MSLGGNGKCIENTAAKSLTNHFRFAWDNESLPASLMDDDNMKLLWDYTNIIIST